MAGFDLDNIFRGALGNDGSAARSALGAEVNNPVGGLYNVEVVLDDQHRVALINQP